MSKEDFHAIIFYIEIIIKYILMKRKERICTKILMIFKKKNQYIYYLTNLNSPFKVRWKTKIKRKSFLLLL